MLSHIYFPNEVFVFSPFTGSLCVQRKQGLYFLHGVYPPCSKMLLTYSGYIRVRSCQGIWEMYTLTSMVYDIYDLKLLVFFLSSNQ